jgi:ParB family chromosome partitioning protein
VTATATKDAQKKEAPLVEYHELHVESLAVVGDNVRSNVGDVTELAASIKEQGLIQPIVATMRAIVDENGEDDLGVRFVVVAGHRRLAAAKLAGLEKVPVILRTMDEQQRIEAMLVENLDRTDISPLDEARGYQRLTDEFSLSQRDIAAKMGRSQGHISKRLVLLELPEEIRKRVDSGGITISDAVELAKLKDHPAHLRGAATTNAWETIPGNVTKALDELKREKLLTTKQEQLESKGLATVRVSSRYQLPTKIHRINDGTIAGDPHALPITPADHAKHSCHAIALFINHVGKVEEFPVCTDRKQHPGLKTRQEKPARGSTAPHPLQKEREALREAETARRTFRRELLKRKLPKEEMLDRIFLSIIDTAMEMSDDQLIVNSMITLGLANEEDEAVNEADLRGYALEGPAQLLRAAFAVALAQSDDYALNEWATNWGEGAASYLAFLERHGYEATAAEKKRLRSVLKAAS